MKFEVCIDTIESALAAASGGADRIEVCGALRVGGITPSYGLLEQCIAMGGVEVMMMIRPHAGGFCYKPGELNTMVRDIRAAKMLGAHGVVLGALRMDGSIDDDVCARLIDVARPLSITFHRAFDLTPDPLIALDSLLELGIDRLLTSGQATTAMEGARLIGDLVRRSGNTLSVIAGAGIRSHQINALVRATNVQEIHASASEGVTEGLLSMLGIVQTTRVTRQEIVCEMVQTIRKIESSCLGRLSHEKLKQETEK